MFQQINLASTANEMLRVIEANNIKAYDVKKEIKELEIEEEISTYEEEPVEQEVREELVEEVQDPFEDEVAYYLDDYQKIEVGFSDEDFKTILPFHRHQNFKMIIQRLYAESLREIKELKEMKKLEEEESFCLEIDTFIEHEKRKMKGLLEALKPQAKETPEDQEEEKNQIILVPTRSGNIRIIDEMEHITSEYYPGFMELIDSIINGTFKGVKRFNNNNILSGICEVKGFQIRILFQRLKKNTYALISAFIKKTDNDKGYQEYVKTRVVDYKSMLETLKSKIDDEEFLKENDFYVSQLRNILNPEEKEKTYKKEAE